MLPAPQSGGNVDRFFISPNYHVMFVHFPLALVTVGVLIELFAFLWKHSAARTAAHWMILLGALSAIPTATTGLYAFANDAQGSVRNTGGQEEMGEWSDVVQNSRWGSEQWRFMRWHIILTSAATGVFVIVSLAYLGATDNLRARMHGLFLVLLICGVGLMLVGAWFSGEAVYRYDLAVNPPALTSTPAGDDLWGDERVSSETEDQHGAAAQRAEESAHSPEQSPPPGSSRWHRQIRQFLPPLQVHTLLAGVTVALAAAGIGAMYRRWNREPRAVAVVVPEPPIGQMRPREVMPGGNRPDTVESAAGVGRGVPAGATVVVERRPAMRVAWLFALALLFALMTALTGLWFTGHGDWHLDELRESVTQWLKWRKVTTDQQRMAIHAVLGVGIVLFSLVLALLTRFARRARAMPVIFVLLLLVAAGLQVYVGISLLYVLKPTVL